MKCTFCGTPVTSWSKRVRSHLILLFHFLTYPFTLTRTVHLYDAAIDFPSTFFYFCDTYLFLIFRNSSDVARRNIFLIIQRMASESIRYSVVRYLEAGLRWWIIIFPREEGSFTN